MKVTVTPLQPSPLIEDLRKISNDIKNLIDESEQLQKDLSKLTGRPTPPITTDTPLPQP